VAAAGGLASHVVQPGVPRVYMASTCATTAPLGANDAEVILGRLEEGLPYAVELDEAFKRKEGRPHPIFEAPAAGLHALAACLKVSR
jgi:hypothetical protein